MNYSESVQYIQNLTKFGYNFGLGRIVELLNRFDNPHLKLKVIHVGGTNGKGSTGAMISSILKETGYKVGLFTSPHLHSYTERFLINGQKIAQEDLAEIVTLIKPQLEDMVSNGFEHPTEFEVGTAVAFLYFYRKKVDFLVMEVGLGGSIDSTNVVDPEVSVITNVSIDHMDYLGNTVREIAEVKAGIIKKGKPLVTAAQGEALEVILEKCRGMNAPAVVIGQDVKWKQRSINTQGQYVDIYGLHTTYDNLFVPLIGEHQQINAATAVAAVEVLIGRGIIPAHCAVEKGLAETVWPARLEIVSNNPLVIIDAAHNYGGAVSLRRTLDEYYPGKRRVLVLGMLSDKERSKVVSELAPGSVKVIITKPNSPRAGDSQLLADEAGHYVDSVCIIDSIVDAVEAGIKAAGPDDLVVITGSFYMVAEAREHLLKMFG